MSEEMWIADPERPELQPPKRSSSRKKGRRRLTTLFAILGALAIIVTSATLAATGAPAATTSSSSTITTTVAAVQTGNTQPPSTETQNAVAQAATKQAVAPLAVASSTGIQSNLASPAATVLQKAYGSVVSISVTADSGRRSASGVGSGVIYTSDGYILTNDHVVTLDGNVSQGQTITVTFSDSTTAPATIVGEDAARDIALIKVAKTGLTPVVFASSSTVRLGDWATVIGSPLDYQNSVTLGIVSGLDRSLDVSQSETLSGLVQIDAPISPGNSGGGCFNALGQFIGMPELYLPPGSTGAENIGFAIPADVVATVAQALIGK